MDENLIISDQFWIDSRDSGHYWTTQNVFVFFWILITLMNLVDHFWLIQIIGCDSDMFLDDLSRLRIFEYLGFDSDHFWSLLIISDYY